MRPELLRNRLSLRAQKGNLTNCVIPAKRLPSVAGIQNLFPRYPGGNKRGGRSSSLRSKSPREKRGNLVASLRAKRSNLLLRLLPLIIPIMLQAQSTQTVDSRALFDQGNQYFQQENYQKAIESYSSILSRGDASAEVYFNLGNAYYKTGDLANAILNYERALKLKPRDQDIEHNLDLVNHRIVDRLEQPPMLFFWHWVNAIRGGLTAKEWGRLSVIGLWVAVAMTALAVFRRRGLFRRPIRYTAGILIVAWLCVFAMFVWKLQRDRIITNAIVTEQKVEVLSAPDETGTVLFDLHEGVKVQVLRNVPGWSEVSLPDPQKRGWLPSEAFEVI
jgi:hypothetical protein